MKASLPRPAEPVPLPGKSVRGLGPALAGSVALTLLAALVALSAALRERSPKPPAPAPEVATSRPASAESGEIDISDWPASSALPALHGAPSSNEREAAPAKP